MPHWLVKPVGSVDGTTLITHYEFSSGLGPPIPLATRDVVHFRFGLDPENVRYGFAPLRPLLREVMTDDQAAQFSETILRNMGVPGLIVSPKNDAWKPSDEETKKLRDYFETAFSGERRGKPFVMKIPTEVAQFGFDPNKLMLSNLRDISEERVCAAFGIPSAVVGFGSGLQSTKVGATMRELRRLAWVQCLTPMQQSLAKQLTAQLLPDFVSQTRRFRARFDTSDVSAFPEDESMRAERVRGLVKDGVITVAYAQELLGLEIDPSRDIYLGPGAVDAEPVEAETPPEAIVGDVGEEDEEEVPNDSDDDDSDAKLLRTISARWASTTNGNGKH
jgi:HK97 family phage portal protein